MTIAPAHTTTAYRALTNELVALGVTCLFGLVGEDTVAFVNDAATAGGIRYFGARHENIAVNMADGYSWATGGLGVCTVTRGPGLMNACMAARTAARSGRRVLIITGDMATNGDWAHDYKSIEHGPLCEAIGLAYFPVGEPSQVVEQFRRAAESAMSGKTAMLAIPVDILNGPLAGGDESSTYTIEVPEEGPPALPSDADVRQVVELLSASKRPLILAGRGALEPETKAALAELAEQTGALLGTTLLAREAFRDSPYNVGIVGGFTSDPVIPVLAEVDCVVSFGAALTPWTTAERTLFKGIPVVQVDSDPAKIGANFKITLGIAADAGATAKRLVEALPVSETREKPFHAAEILAHLRQPLYLGPDDSTHDRLDPRMIASTLDGFFPEERTIVLDSGRHMTSPGRFMHVTHPTAFRHTADGGAIGMGLGIALGAAAARPDEPTILFAGDGGMSMTMNDLETAVRNELPLIVIVQDDCAYGSELVHLKKDGLPWEYATLPEIDFAAVAAALGIESHTVTTLDQLKSHRETLRNRTTPVLLHCKIRQDLFPLRVRWSD